jgi:hypothetical protein
MKGFSVCLLPYLINAYTTNVYPSKVHQYLAGGKPVVSTPMPELEYLSELIGWARNHIEFEEMVRQALEHQPAEVERRIGVARENSISYRTRQKVDLLRETLAARVKRGF